MARALAAEAGLSRPPRAGAAAGRWPSAGRAPAGRVSAALLVAEAAHLEPRRRLSRLGITARYARLRRDPARPAPSRASVGTPRAPRGVGPPESDLPPPRARRDHGVREDDDLGHQHPVLRMLRGAI